MPINHGDGMFGIDCWENAKGVGDSDSIEYSDNAQELRDRATTLLKGGRFKYIVLYHWNAGANDWDELEEFGSDDL